MQENLLFCSKQGIGQFPVLNEMPIFLCITYLTKKNCMLSFFQIISTQMDISVSFFALIQCYWLEDGSEVLENSLLIPRWKKFEFPTRGFAAHGKFIFFTSGFGGNSPIPPRHHQANNIVIERKIKEIVQNRVLTNTLFLRNMVLANTLFWTKE